MRINTNLVAPLLVLAFALHGNAHAATYKLPPPGEHVVGAIQEITASSADTLLDIGRRHGVGLYEISAANPGIDPWLPKDGQRVIIPTQHILPDAPREGIVINLPEMRLYYYPRPAPGESPVVITYPLGVGAEGKATPLGLTRIIAKAIDPPWVVPESVRAEHAAEGEILPRVVPPGANNPLGRHAMRLGMSTYLIHGTNEPFSIGMRASNGCLRMYPEDIASLYTKVAVGTSVRIINTPVKAGWLAGELYLEAHQPMTEPDYAPRSSHGSLTVAALVASSERSLPQEVWDRAMQVTEEIRGFPVPILRVRTPETPSRDEPARNVESTSGEDGWLVQVGAFRDTGNARVLARMVNNLEPAEAATLLRSGPLCRVLIGPFASKEAAHRARERIKASSSLPGVLVPAREMASAETCAGEGLPPDRQPEGDASGIIASTLPDTAGTQK